MLEGDSHIATAVALWPRRLLRRTLFQAHSERLGQAAGRRRLLRCGWGGTGLR